MKISKTILNDDEGVARQFAIEFDTDCSDEALYINFHRGVLDKNMNFVKNEDDGLNWVDITSNLDDLIETLEMIRDNIEK